MTTPARAAALAFMFLALLSAVSAMPAWAARYEFRVTQDYRFGYRADIAIVNEADDETIADWTLVLRFPQHRIEASWQTRFRADAEAGVYVFGRAPDGPVIPPGHTFRFTVAGTPGNVSGKPELLALDTTTRPAATTARPRSASDCTVPVDIEVTPAVKTAWPTGYTYAVGLRNRADRPVGPWQLEFLIDPAMRVAEQWDTFVYSRDGDRYRLHPLAYNARLQPGESMEIGFNVRWEEAGREPLYPYAYTVVECR